MSKIKKYLDHWHDECLPDPHVQMWYNGDCRIDEVLEDNVVYLDDVNKIKYKLGKEYLINQETGVKIEATEEVLKTLRRV